MKGISFRTIFILLVIILIIIAVYKNFEKKREKIVLTEMTYNKNTIISNNLRIGIIEFDNINPIISNNKNVQDISRLIFEPLFTLTPEYKLQPTLATEYYKLDSTTYLIRLRENVKWQDGNNFDVSDVIFTIDMLKSMGSDSIYFYNVKNISEIQKIDNYTLRIIIDQEIPFYEYNFIFPIVSSKYFNEENFFWESKNINPTGTGKFYISNVENDTITLKKNISNWENSIIQLDTITIRLYGSLTSAINAFKTEEIDMFTTSKLDIEDYLEGFQYIEKDYINRNYYYMALNTESRVLENIEVRQAINSAINKEELINDLYRGKYKISNFPIDFGSYAYNIENSHMSFDENTAKNLLIDHGWEYSSREWKKVIEDQYLNLELSMVAKKSDRNSLKIANKIKENLEKVGMNINLIEASDGQYESYKNKKNYDLIIVNSIYSYAPTLGKYFEENNLANYNNERVNQFVSNAKILTDETELREIYTKINDIYNEEVPYVSICFNINTLIYGTSVKGKINPNSYNLFYGINGWYREYEKKDE